VVALKPLKKIASQQRELNQATGRSIDRLQNSDQFSAKQAEFASLMVPEGIGAKQILFVGTGDDKKMALGCIGNTTKLASGFA